MDVNATAIHLIDRIYDAAEHQEAWPEVLEAVGKAVSSIASCFTIENTSTGTSSMSVFAEIDPSFQKAYNEYYQKINLHILRARLPLHEDQIVSGHTLCTDEELLASEYYQDFLRPQEWFYPFGGCVSRGRPLMAVLSFFHSRRQGPCTDRQVDLLNLLMPHFRRAVRLQAVLGSAGASLESIPLAIALSDRAGKIRFANHAARGVFDQNDGFSVDSGGNMRCDFQAHNRLLKLIYEAGECAAGRGVKAGGVVFIPRPSAGRPYSVKVSQIHYSFPAPGGSRPTVLLTISDPETEPEIIVPWRAGLSS